MTVNRRARTVAGETEIAHVMRQVALDVMRRVDRGAERVEIWWKAQIPRTRVGLSIVALILTASLLNVIEMNMVRANAARPAGVQATLALVNESAPADAGKVWSVAKMWQGATSYSTETFTVGDHWRVDWVFNQTQPLGQLQVFIYGADGTLLNVATSVARSDSNTTFWAGPGTYLLKVNSTGGDWKLDVQDLH